MTRFTYLLFSKYGKVSWILSRTLSWVILDENSITDLVLRFRMSLNEVCSSLVFIRVTVLEKELHLNLFALAPAPGWVIICSDSQSAVMWKEMFFPWKKITKLEYTSMHWLTLQARQILYGHFNYLPRTSCQISQISQINQSSLYWWFSLTHHQK